ncbi:MAG: hypothetical protein KAJ14_10605 [Candidatus Omnitrophica bacterium]|nr:hypothetical protein [Candidatus Omnitrophota bacterium]
MKSKITKILLSTFLIPFIFLFSPLNASAEILFGKDYQQTLHKHLTQAEKSITIAMYFIILEPKGKGPINELVKGEEEGKKRDVDKFISLLTCIIPGTDTGIGVDNFHSNY